MADSYQSRCAEESISPALVPHTRVVNSLGKSYWIVLKHIKGSKERYSFTTKHNMRMACVYFWIYGKDACFTKDHQKSETDWTRGSKFVVDVADPVTPSRSRFSCLFFAVCVN